MKTINLYSLELLELSSMDKHVPGLSYINIYRLILISSINRDRVRWKYNIRKGYPFVPSYYIDFDVSSAPRYSELYG